MTIVSDRLDQIAAALTGLDDPDEVRRALREYDVRDIIAVLASTGTGNGGGTLPQLGRPKSDSAVTFYGIPHAIATYQTWTTAPTLGTGELRYTPFAVLTPITLMAIQATLDSLATDGEVEIDTPVSVYLSAADEDWQPIGDILLSEQFAFTVLGGGLQELEIDLEEPIALASGMYLTAYESALSNVQTEANGTGLMVAAPVPSVGSYQCADSGGAMIQYLIADGFREDPTVPLTVLPRWDAVQAGTPDDPYNLPLHSVLFEWDPT